MKEIILGLELNDRQKECMVTIVGSGSSLVKIAFRDFLLQGFVVRGTSYRVPVYAGWLAHNEKAVAIKGKYITWTNGVMRYAPHEEQKV